LRHLSHRARLRLHELEARYVPTFLGNQVFPLDNPWNQVIAAAPVAANSDAIINRILARNPARKLHADFGNPATDGALYGIPINVVDSTVPKVTVYIPDEGYPDESDLVQVPIPANAVIEGDGATGPADPDDRGDSHLLIYDRTANVLYELYQAVRPNETSFPYGGTNTSGQWGAYQISVWNLNTNSFRTIGATSADAAGLPILPGLVRPDEALPVADGGQGAIKHAIRMTVAQTRDMFVFPASHETGPQSASDLPRMGERFRLKASFVIPANWSPEAKAIAQAMKDYGLIVADNGSDMYFQGTPSTDWDMDDVLQIQQIGAGSFEVVDLTPVVTGLSVVGGSTTGGTTVTITGRNFSGAAGQLHVLFGTTEATSVTVVSDTQLIAVAPAHASGLVDVRVRSGTNRTNTDGQQVFFGYGTSANTAADDFRFVRTTPPAGVAGQPFAVGAAAGRPGRVTLYDADRSVRFVAYPFGTAYKGGWRVAVGDVTGDGVVDVVAVTASGPARARVIDGSTGAVTGPQLLGATGYTGPVFVAVGDVTGDGTADIALGTNQGGPLAQVFRGGTFQRIAVARNTTSGFKGNTQVAIADVNGDTRADLVVTALYGAGARVFGYNGTSLAPGSTPVRLFPIVSLGGAYTRPAFTAVGDVNGDGYADLVFGSAPTAAANVTVFSGKALTQTGALVKLAAFAPPAPSTATGVRVAVRDVDGDGTADLLTSSGERVSAFKGGALSTAARPPLLFSFDPDALTGGVWVG
jgi:hypothetical protein